MADWLDACACGASNAQQRCGIDRLSEHGLLETGEGFLVQAAPILGRPGAQLLVQALGNVLQGNACHATILQPKRLHRFPVALQECPGKRREVFGTAGQTAALRQIGLSSAFSAISGRQLLQDCSGIDR